MFQLNKQIAIKNSFLFTNKGSGLEEFLSSLFARQRFITQLLERNFNQPIGWIELLISIGLMAISYSLSHYLIRKYQSYTRVHPFLRHLLNRALWPILLLLFAAVTLYLWNILGHQDVWLRLLLMAARWMILIRLSLAFVNAALPKTKLSDWLERFLASALWVMFILWVSGADNFIIRTLQAIKLPIGSINPNLYTILTGVIWIAIVLLLAMWFSRLIENKLMKRQSLDINLRIVLSKIIKAALIMLAVLIALPLVGIDLTVLSVFSGALGVGIGFGLQKVASNYISGFIILGDRSIRPGDRLTVNNFTGYVTEITSRYVVLKSAAGAEALIPNELFITSTVINESYTGKSLWQSLNIQVAYHTDLTQALNILEQAAFEQERVKKDPAPKAVLVNFGENGIDLRLGFWVKDPENGFAGLFSDILLDIWKQFNENGIEFPYPQREVRILNETSIPDKNAIIRAGRKAQDDTCSDKPTDGKKEEH